MSMPPERWLRLLALLLVLAGCAPTVVAPGPPVTEPRLEDDWEAVMADGARLPLEVWRPQGAPLAGVVALHGFGDYGNAFRELGPAMAEAGIAVYAIDQRGFGEAPRPGRWHGARTMADDAATMARLVRRELPGRPVYLLGESMGGAVAMLAQADANPAADGAILSAPAVWGRDWMPAIQVGALELAGHTVPWLPLNPRGLNVRPTDNIELLRQLARDPLFIREPRVDAVYGLVDLMDAAQRAAPDIRSPVLVLYGARDELVPKAPTCAMLDRLAPGRRGDRRPVRIAVYPDGHHMLFRDLNGRDVIADMAAWARDPSAALPSGAEVAPGSVALQLFCAGADGG